MWVALRATALQVSPGILVTPSGWLAAPLAPGVVWLASKYVARFSDCFHVFLYLLKYAKSSPYSPVVPRGWWPGWLVRWLASCLADLLFP